MAQENKSLGDRLMNLELLFTHLERQVAELHDVILRQQNRSKRPNAGCGSWKGRSMTTMHPSLSLNSPKPLLNQASGRRMP